MQDNKNINLKNDISSETLIFVVLFLIFFIGIGRIMGGTNMMNTMMNTAFYLLMNVCFYLFAVATVAGGISALFSEFGVISFINKFVSVIMKPLYELPGAASSGVPICFMSYHPAIFPLAHDDNFRQYFKKYQLPALTNLGTSFGMGLIVCTSMMVLPIEGAFKASMVGLLGAVVGSIISVRIMISRTKKYYGTTDMVETINSITIPEGKRVVRDGSGGKRFIEALLDGGKVGLDMGLSIIPGVLLICTVVIMLTNGTGDAGVYDGSANQGIALLPMIGSKLNFILNPLFGFKSPDAIAVPITALGSSGAAIGMVSQMAKDGKIFANDIAVFTSICMCWSGYLSTHIAMMNALDTKEMTGNAIMSHTIGGFCAGIASHILWMVLG